MVEDFDTSLMYDDIEKIREIEEAEEKDQNNKLTFAGMMALIAGVVLFVVAILGGGILGWSLFEFLSSVMPFIGFGALGYGFYKMLKLVFRKKELSFPALNVYRKTRPVAASPENTGTRNENAASRRSARQSRRRPPSSAPAYQRKELRRSRTNRVFAGVVGGLAEYFGISSTLLRFAFVISIFATSGSSIFLYLLLSIILPSKFEPFRDYRKKESSSNAS